MATARCEEDCYTDVDLLLVGKTGNGKSSLGNAILKRECFRESSSVTSETKNLESGEGKHRQTKIKVVDGPGFADTQLDKPERVKQMHGWLEKAINENVRGYHAFLLVLRFGARFTDDEKETTQFFKDTFGTNFVQNHCVVVMTHGDNFQRESERTGKTFESWCGEQRGIFKDLIDECKGRVVLFANHAKGRALDAQLDNLLDIVSQLGGKRYTNERFEAAAKLRAKQLVEAEKPKLQKEVWKRLERINEMLADRLPHYKLKDEFDELLTQVKQWDRSTGVLNDIEGQIMQAMLSVSHQTNTRRDKEQTDQMSTWEKAVAFMNGAQTVCSFGRSMWSLSQDISQGWKSLNYDKPKTPTWVQPRRKEEDRTTGKQSAFGNQFAFGSDLEKRREEVRKHFPFLNEMIDEKLLVGKAEQVTKSQQKKRTLQSATLGRQNKLLNQPSTLGQSSTFVSSQFAFRSDLKIRREEVRKHHPSLAEKFDEGIDLGKVEQVTKSQEQKRTGQSATLGRQNKLLNQPSTLTQASTFVSSAKTVYAVGHTVVGFAYGLVKIMKD